MTYSELDEKLQGRCKNRRKLGNNTWAYRDEEFPQYIKIRFHLTDIMRFDPDGLIHLSVGRWFTVTSKQRLNEYLPDGYGIWSTKGQWMVWRVRMGHYKPIAIFTNGMILHSWNGEVSGTQTYEDWVALQAIELHKRRSEISKAQNHLRCWTWTGDRYCNYFLTKEGACVIHGLLALPGHEQGA